MPTVFIGSVPQIRADLLERGERFGLTHLVTADAAAVLAEIIAGL